MADHGEKPTLAPAWDSHREGEDAEPQLCESMGHVVFRPSLYMLGEIMIERCNKRSYSPPDLSIAFAPSWERYARKYSHKTTDTTLATL